MKISNTLTEKVIPGFTACGIIFICTLASCVCLGLNIRSSLFTSVICSLLSIPLNKQILAPDGFLLVPAVLVLTVTGTTGFALSIISGYLLFVLLKAIFKDFSLPCFTAAGGALGLAFCVTALFTTLYFGIGATGKTTWEILKNYRYLGFHPNWRGVFYGTVTLFAMITYPFKFKKLSKYLPKEVFSAGIPFLRERKNSCRAVPCPVSVLLHKKIFSGRSPLKNRFFRHSFVDVVFFCVIIVISFIFSLRFSLIFSSERFSMAFLFLNSSS